MEIIDLLSASPALLLTVCIVLGLLVGSFLNVVVYRLPIMLSAIGVSSVVNTSR